jgi:uncharacterized membrane protein
MEIQRGQHYQGHPEASQNDRIEGLAKGLGWFGIGLGLAQVAAPGSIAKLIGISHENGRRTLIRLCGLREIATGIGILSQRKPAGWLWGRVAGDLLDLASLGSAMKSDNVNRTRVTMAAGAVLGVTALDVYCGQQLSRRSAFGITSKDGRVHVTKTIIINRPPEEVYAFWRNFENFPRFMQNLESVQVTGDRRSHWRAKAPAGMTVEWDAEIINDQPNSLMSWRSLPGSDIDHSGTVRFERAAGGRGTLIRVELEYAPPGGAIGARIAKLFGKKPGQQIGSDLRLLKQVLETGEVVRSEASIHPGMHPAQPPAHTERATVSGVRRRGAETSADAE